VISAEVASRVPGHQATNHPLPVVVWMSSPSLRTRVTPVTSASTWPSTTVYAPSLVESRWATVDCSTPSEPLPATREMDELALPCPVPLALPETLSEPPLPELLETAVSDGPVRQVASELPSW
jgi:hypothetical protein